MDAQFCSEAPSSPGSWPSIPSPSLLQVGSSRDSPSNGTASLISTEVDVAMQDALEEADHEVAAWKSRQLPMDHFVPKEGTERKPNVPKRKEYTSSSYRVATNSDDNDRVVIVPERDAERNADATTSGDACQPLCKWECESTRCEGECTPECEQPRCETRCSAATTKGCVMECNRPQCYTLCPKRSCAGAGGCPLCTTNCSKPMCRLRCPQQQDCRGVCEEPRCKWRCKEPSTCPAPKCRLACEEPSCVLGSQDRAIPALRRGEIKVSSFVAPRGIQDFGRASPSAALYQVSADKAPDRNERAEIVSLTVPVLVETVSEDSQPNSRTVTIPVLVNDRPKRVEGKTG